MKVLQLICNGVLLDKNYTVFFYKKHERTMEETILQEKWFFKEKNPYIFWQNVHNETKPK